MATYYKYSELTRFQAARALANSEEDAKDLLAIADVAMEFMLFEKIFKHPIK